VIVALNPNAKIIEATYGEVDMSELLDTGHFDFDKAYYGEGWVKAMDEYDKEQKEHHHHHDHDHHDHDHEEHEHHHEHHEEGCEGGKKCHCKHHHHHHGEGEAEEYGIGSFVYYRRVALVKSKFRQFVDNMPKNIIRTKGIVWYSSDNDNMYIFEQWKNSLSLYRLVA
jgi:G3E family GTPase